MPSLIQPSFDCLQLPILTSATARRTLRPFRLHADWATGTSDPPTEGTPPQIAAVNEGESQPRSSGKPPDEAPRLGLLLASLMSESGLDRNETARLCGVQPQTIKNALDFKSVNARFVVRLIDVFELRDRPRVLRYALISHLALQLGDRWLDLLQRAHLVSRSSPERRSAPALSSRDVVLTDALSTVMEVLQLEPADLALRCDVSPRVVRECLRGKNISAQLVRGVSALVPEDDRLLRRVLLSYMAQQYGPDSIALMTAARLLRN